MHWHVFHGTNTNTGLRLTVTIGGAMHGPDDTLPSGGTVRTATVPFPDLAVTATYRATFGYPPAAADLAAAGIPTDDDTMLEAGRG